MTVRYEGYGPGGVAVIVEALTDNRNRTGGAVRAVFTKYAGNLGATGSSRTCSTGSAKSFIRSAAGSADALLEAAIEAGPTTSSAMSGHPVSRLRRFGRSAELEATLGRAQSVKAVWKPSLTTAVDEDKAESILKLIAALEDDDDVQAVFANFEIDEATMARLTAG